MIASTSSAEQKLNFLKVLEQLTSKLREQVLENQLLELSMKDLEGRIARLGRLDVSPSTTFNITTPNGSGQVVSVQVDNGALSEGTLSSEPSIYIHGEIFANPVEEYSDKCNTKLASPTVSVQLFSETQQPIKNIDSTIPLFQTTLPVNITRGRNESYSFVCKYFDEQAGHWQNDTRICKTIENADGTVTCQCYQPVTHAVSLDYIQASENDAESVCDNPCGCISRKKPLASWAIALIVIGCVSGIVLAAALLIVILVAVGKPMLASKEETSQLKQGAVEEQEYEMY